MILGLVAVVALLQGDPRAAEGPKPLLNAKCPVKPGREASREHSVVYRGKRVFFCCLECMSLFEQEPKKYLFRLPQFSGEFDAALESANAPASFEVPEPSPLLRNLADLRALLLFVGIMLVGLLAARRSRRLAWLSRPSVAGTLVLLPALLCYVILYRIRGEDRVVQNRELRSMDARLRGLNAKAMVQEHAVDQLIQLGGVEHVRGLERTYYRGNDERNPILFNNGVYRTATINLSLVRADGSKVRPGDGVSGETLHVRIEIRRAKFTPDRLFSPTMMSEVAVLRDRPLFGPQSESGQFEVKGARLKTLESGQRWEVRIGVGTATRSGEQRISGSLYLGRAPDTQLEHLRTSAHYVIPYDLVLNEGRILHHSRLWMAASIVPGIFRKEGLQNWFSLEEIQELPGPHRTTDTKILGIDDYVAPGSGKSP